MTGLTFDDPCVLFALRRESSAFRHEFRPHQRFPGAPCPAYFCGPSWLTVLAAETGVGAVAADRALSWLLDAPLLENVPYRPKLVLFAGFAGALAEDHKVGDVILATEVADCDGRCWPATWPATLPPGCWQPPLHRGKVLTVATLVGCPEEKRSLGLQHGAVAVDMESAVVARRCSERSVPFGCVRVISDDLHTSLSPRLAALLRDGRVSLFRVMMAVLAAPRLAGELRRLAGQTRLAARQLGTALGELLTLTLLWGKDL